MSRLIREIKNVVRAACLPGLIVASLLLPANAPAQQQGQDQTRKKQQSGQQMQQPRQQPAPPVPQPGQRQDQAQQKQQSEQQMQRRSQQQPPQQAQQRGQQRRDMARNFRQSYEDKLEDYIVVGMAEYNNLIPNVKVRVNDQTAILSGRVPNERAKLRAARVALSSRYIRNVQNNIQVDPGMTKTYNELARNVNEEELARNVAQRIAARIDGAKAGEDWWLDGWRVEGPYGSWTLVVEPEEYGGITLEGELPSLEIMRTAVEAASAVPGVRRVNTNFDRQDYFGYSYGRGYEPYGYDPYAFRGPYDSDRYYDPFYDRYAYPYAYGNDPYYSAYR